MKIGTKQISSLFFTFVFLLFLNSSLSFSQTDSQGVSHQKKAKKIKPKKLLNKARTYSVNGAHDLARDCYKQLLEIDSTNIDYNFELGMNYHKNTTDCRECAIPCFTRAIRHFGKDTVYEVYYYLAQAYKFQEQYDDAIKNFQNFQPFLYTEKFGEELQFEFIDFPTEQCLLAKQLMQRVNTAIAVEHLDTCINDVDAEYVPVVTENDSIIMFTSRNKTSTGGHVDRNDDKYYEDMFISRKVNGSFAKAEKFVATDSYEGNLKNTKKHDAVVWMSYDEKRLITYKNKNIFLSEKNGNVWSKAEVFPENINMSDWQPHGSISPDGNTIYFSSSSTKGYGGLDIWQSTKNSDGTWGPAVNLGSEINSRFDEDSPNIWVDGKTLYFSSKNNSMGGYDVFVSRLTDSNKWSKPVNLGMPINSPGDDIYFKPNAAFTQGYFSSFRKQGFGDMDIYKFKMVNADCKPFANPTYTKAFDGTPYLTDKNDASLYQWDFGDGAKSNNLKTEHAYQHPGVYKTKFSVIDSAKGAVDVKEKYVDIVIDNVNYLNFTTEDTISVDSLLTLDATGSMIKDIPITGYEWDYGDNYSGHQIKSTHKYLSAGTYCVTLVYDIDYTKDKWSAESLFPKKYYTSKMVVVLSSNAYRSYTDGEGYKYSMLKRYPSYAASLANKDVKVAKLNSKNDKPKDTKSTDLTNVLGLDGSDIPDLQLEPVYFDFNKSIIRNDAKQALDRNIAKLKANPTVIIKVSANTDSRGSFTYNEKLSNRRAKAAVDYMTKHGIKRKRIVKVIALGETQLVNKCADGVKCDDDEHQKNRRDDFSIIGTKK